MPKVSVIIPTYNRENLVLESIRSVFAQTFADFEIIVVDDGSTDNTREILQPYLSKIKYIYHRNTGQSFARNLGILASEGEYLAFLDSDDIWEPKKLKIQVEILNKEKNIGLIFTNFKKFDKGRIIFESRFDIYKLLYQIPIEKADGYNIFKKKVFRELLEETWIFTPTVMVRKECFAKAGLFNPDIRFSEDWELFLRLARHFYFAYIDRPLVKVRSHSENISEDLLERLLGEIEVLRLVNATYPNLNNSILKIISSQLSLRQYSAGYQYFSRGNLYEARKQFRLSFSEKKSNFKAYSYFLVSCLPQEFVKIVRNIKKLF